MKIDKTYFLNFTLKEFNIEDVKQGDILILNSRPSTWSSYLTESFTKGCGRDKVKYPYELKIIKIEYSSGSLKDHTPLLDQNGYGWNLDTIMTSEIKPFLRKVY